MLQHLGGLCFKAYRLLFLSFIPDKPVSPDQFHLRLRAESGQPASLPSAPDIKVANSPETVVKGEDTQLKAAVRRVVERDRREIRRKKDTKNRKRENL